MSLGRLKNGTTTLLTQYYSWLIIYTKINIQNLESSGVIFFNMYEMIMVHCFNMVEFVKE